MKYSNEKDFKSQGDICPELCPTPRQPCLVIVKGFLGEPAKLWAIEDMGSSVRVYGTDERKPIGYPKRYVYHYNELVFKDIKKAFESCNQVELNRLWEQADRI